MKADSSTSTASRLAIGLVECALIASAALVSAPAQASTHAAATVVPASVRVPCIKPAARPTKWRRAADTERVSARVRAQVASVVRTAARASAVQASRDNSARAAAPGRIVVPVFIHVIHGRHKGEHRIGKHAARRAFKTLKGGYAGAQDATMTPTGVVFRLRRITVSRNEQWFHARPYSRADRQMKNRLHRGTTRVLNIYLNRPKVPGTLLLGFSTFPWQGRSHPRLDGVTISDFGLRNGRAVGYNLGDTVIHETGHWLGLLHTFEGGCDDADGVADTPAEALPSYRCDERNTCPVDPANPSVVVDDGLPDPIHNFMDYSYDTCMYQFTPGQSARMITLFKKFRVRR